MTRGICPFAVDITAQINADCYAEGGEAKVGFCDHTAGGYYTTLASPAFWNGAGVTTHFGISQLGEIVQIVNIFDRAYAQGRDSRGGSVGPTSPGITWAPFGAMGKRNPNEYLISTEHEDETITNVVWSDAMYAADLRVKRWCVEEVAKESANALRFGLDSLAGHFMFDPVNRVYCPGTNWPRDRIYADLVAEGKDEDLMNRWQGIANPDYFHGLELLPRDGVHIQDVWARSDFGLPAQAKSIELVVYLSRGALDVLDFTGKKAGFAEAGVSHWRVFMDASEKGLIGLRAIPGVSTVIDKLECVGWY